VSEILLYDPYLETLGGGERYMFGLASAWQDEGNVTIAGATVPSIETLRSMGFPTEFRMVSMPDWQLAARSLRYDVAVSLASELPGPMGAKRALLVVQFPFPFWLGQHPVRRILRRALRARLLARYECVVYSRYVQKWLAERWHVPSTILHPPVRQRRYDEARKRRTILAVGRFFVGDHCKRQDAIVEAFGRVHAELPGWRLVLAGGMKRDAESESYVDGLRRQAGKLPVDIEIDVSADRLDRLFEEASMFVHAAGYGRADDQPEKAEHFGISTVEAMSAGAVPLVFADGGQLEIVTGDNGVLWRDLDQLADSLVALATDEPRRASMAAAAAADAGYFTEERFRREALELLHQHST
jgi:glycosyltransferase involved in cell wall biosynthesis